MNFTKINCHGANLTVPEFLVPSWPYDLPLDKWPTFCGSGEGWGDAIVPDRIHGVPIGPAGLCHDIEWACSSRNLSAFMGSNGRFFLNITALIQASNLPTWEMIRALIKAGVIYLAAVSTMGVLFFSWFSKRRREDLNPFENPTVKSRLAKLKKAKDAYRLEVENRLQDADDMMYRDDEGWYDV